MDIQSLHSLFISCGTVSTDTRQIPSGSMFFALRGDKFDANEFAAEALQKGAAYAVIDNMDRYIDERTIVVSDTLIALQQLAAFHRVFLQLPVIALTGSNGKTTTKELLHAVLSKKYKVKATKGNLNNHIGVPLTLLSFDSETEIGIVEMGANHQKEIEFLCNIARPAFGYITNFGKAHLEGFGSAEGVIKGKSEMYDYLRAGKKMAFVNLDDAIQTQKTQDMQRFTFGVQNPIADLEITSVAADPFVCIEYSGVSVQSNLIGLYNSGNICAAIAIGNHFGVNNDQVKEAIEGYIPANNRSQLIKKNGNEIILDAYNANPSSMEAAIANFLQLNANNKMMILGDMFELGADSPAEHSRILKLLENEQATDCHFVGTAFHAAKFPKANFYFHENFDDLAHAIQEAAPEDKLILIKGSRGMALERVLDLI